MQYADCNNRTVLDLVRRQASLHRTVIWAHPHVCVAGGSIDAITYVGQGVITCVITRVVVTFVVATVAVVCVVFACARTRIRVR